MANNHFMISASEHLSRNDSRLGVVIDYAGLCTLKPHTDYYQELVESIIGQQLSLKAAASILSRFRDIYDDRFPTPEEILTTPHERLRLAGLSNAKAGYIKDLAGRITDGSVGFDNLDNLSDEEIIKELTKVKGIGEWTVHMFLIFCVGRYDVLPTGDLGIKSGIRKIYELDHLPTPDEVREIAKAKGWSPYSSIASWYVWKALEKDWDAVKIRTAA